MTYELQDVELAARQLTGSAAEMSAMLYKLMGQQPAISPDASLAEQKKFHIRELQRPLMVAAIKHRLASDFGECYNWKRTKKYFTPEVLARRGVWDGRCHDAIACWPQEFIDHPYFYRTGTRASALVSHLYNMSPSIKTAAQVWADKNGLSVSFPDNYPSWWFPGSTTLVLFTSRIAGGEHGGR